MPSTDPGYATTREKMKEGYQEGQRSLLWTPPTAGTLVRPCPALTEAMLLPVIAGTDAADAAMGAYYRSGTDVGYGRTTSC
eukprot:2537011-Rhodomonas_salina.1